MKQLLTVILRNQFNLFYRFGYTYVPKAYCIEFEYLSSDKTRDSLVGLFNNITPFEYDEEYVILHLVSLSEIDKEVYHFETQDIVSIYPLSMQAKNSIESKIDQRIKLEKPIFESLLQFIENKIDDNERKRAIDALWHLYGFNENVEDFISKIGYENIVKGLEDRKNGIKAINITNGNYWEYLIAYDRYDYFPNSTLGYFYDAGQIFAFSNGQSTFEGGNLHKCLEDTNSKNPQIKMPNIIKQIESEEQSKSYISLTLEGDIKKYIITPLYLKLREEIRKTDNISESMLFRDKDWLKNEFGDSFKYVVILLGAFFGFRKFYDAYYDSLNLKFFKPNNQPINEPIKKSEIHGSSFADKNNTINKDNAELIVERLCNECKSAKSDKNTYLSHIQQYGINDKLINAIKNDKQINKGKEPKNVIKFFEKEIKNPIIQKLEIKIEQTPFEGKSKDIFNESQLCWDNDAFTIFDTIEFNTKEQKERLIKNLQHVQRDHRKKNDSNNEVIKHLINLCADRNNKFPQNKVPNFQLIEEKITEILKNKYPN